MSKKQHEEILYAEYKFNKQTPSHYENKATEGGIKKYCMENDSMQATTSTPMESNEI